MKCYTNSSKRSAKWLSIGLIAFSLFLFPATELSAEEPAERFLQALRDRGLYKVALHYLDGAGKTESVAADFRERVLFEKAQILIDSVAKIRSGDEISKRLDQADKLLSSYSKKVSDPLRSTEVKKIQANVRYFRGRNYLKQAESDKTPEKKKKKYFSQANKLLGDAIPTYREVQKSQATQLDNFVIDPQDKNSDKALQKLQASYVDTRLKVPVAMEKYALSFQGKPKQRNSKLVEAGKEFEAVAVKYDGRFLQGQMARAFAAKCYQLAGKPAESFKQLNLVFDYPSPPKPLVQEGLVVGIDTWPKVKPYPYKAVIKAAAQPVALLSRRDKSNPTWLRIQLELARAKHKESEALKKKDPKAAKKLQNEASRLAREVARRANPHSKMAADLLKGWGVSVTAVDSEEAVAAADLTPATSFADAKQKSTELIQPLSSQLTDLNAAKRGIDKLKGDEKSNREVEVKELQAAVSRQANQALGMLSQAVRFADKDTPRADLNNVRYLQSYCHFAKGRYSNSAVIGRFLMEKYPTIDWSRQASALMVRSYERIFDSSTGPGRDLARDKIIEAASAMSTRWADSNESASAAVAATRVAVLDGDFEAADRFFSKIPANSPNRGPLAAKIGQEIWGQRKTATDEKQRMKVAKSAKQFLSAAIENSDPATMNFSIGVAALYYIDASRDAGDVREAVKRSDEMLKSLDSNKVIGKSTKFRQSAYNAALNTYLAALSGGGVKGKPQKWIDKSKGVIKKMADEAAGDSKAVANVSRVYRKVAIDLEDKFESLPNLKEKESFAASLQSFFSAIGSGAKDGKTRLWAGSTLLSIAESLKSAGGDAKGKELAAEAIGLLDAAKEAGFDGDEKLELNYQQQLALAQRSSGDYEAAVKSFEAILAKANGLNLQIDAAKTLFLWGVEKNEGQPLVSAMNGRTTYKDPKTGKSRKRIWGWKTLDGLTRGNEKFREQFRECKYYSVLCRLRYGEIADSKKAIQSAKKDLDRALQRFDDLAVGPWKKKYDQLLKDLESALN